MAEHWHPFNLEDTDQYKALDQYMEDNPGEVKTWMENHPVFTGHARFWGKPHIDDLGSENFKDFLN